MKNQMIFKRYEIKYMITRQQQNKILKAVSSYIRDDDYGKSTICNIYFDTESSLLVRRSLEKPVYKEKLRIRSYGRAEHNSNVFIELKKKYDSVVYKRRMMIKEENIYPFFDGRYFDMENPQIAEEIYYFSNLYKPIMPKVFLSYDRIAFYSKDDENFRITFDENILCRDYDLSLCSGAYGDPILPCGMVLMEIKTSGAIPVWMSKILSENSIFKSSFSKYGTYYQDYQQKFKDRKEYCYA